MDVRFETPRNSRAKLSSTFDALRKHIEYKFPLHSYHLETMRLSTGGWVAKSMRNSVQKCANSNVVKFSELSDLSHDNECFWCYFGTNLSQFYKSRINIYRAVLQKTISLTRGRLT